MDGQVNLKEKAVGKDPEGTLNLRVGALERNIRKIKHRHVLPLLGLMLGGILDVPSDCRKTRVPRRWEQGKCSRRLCPVIR